MRRVAARWVPHALTDEQKQARVDVAKCLYIGVGRFRIVGGCQGLEFWGAKGEGGQIPSRHMTS